MLHILFFPSKNLYLKISTFSSSSGKVLRESGYQDSLYLYSLQQMQYRKRELLFMSLFALPDQYRPYKRCYSSGLYFFFSLSYVTLQCSNSNSFDFEIFSFHFLYAFLKKVDSRIILILFCYLDTKKKDTGKTSIASKFLSCSGINLPSR